MYRRSLSYCRLWHMAFLRFILVIISNLDVVRIVVVPAKAYSPLIIYSNTEPSATVALKFLQPIPTNGPKILKSVSRIEHQ